MKRRELIKTGLLGLGAGAVTLSGCDREEKDKAANSYSDELKITPKQTGTYEFSVPMPFNYKTIDELLELNATFKKSQITSLHNNTPGHISKTFNHAVQVFRTPNKTLKTYDDFFKYVKYSIDNGFKFVYLMNSPKPFSKEDHSRFKDDMLYILDNLKKYNVKDIKIGNPQVADLISELAPNEFNFSASTALEYHSPQQYEYLFNNYPNFSLIDVANDENQNFKYLKLLKERFPKIKLELMVNEPCIKRCPARISHVAEPIGNIYDCGKLAQDMGYMHFFVKTGAIYPWNLEYYSALGINNFKFIVLEITSDFSINNTRANFHDVKGLKSYLSCVEGNEDKVPLSDFFVKIYPKNRGIYIDGYSSEKLNNMTIADLKEYLPDIRQFIAHGHECEYKCGVECNYCKKCANKLENLLLYS